MKIEGSHSDITFIFVAAFRYALPRQTYATDLVANMIVKNLDLFADWELKNMAREIKEHKQLFGFSSVDVAIWDNLHYTLTEEYYNRNNIKE